VTSEVAAEAGATPALPEIPPIPPSRGPGQDGGVAEILPRYEDIAQDGRIRLPALLHGVGESVWRPLIAALPSTPVLRDAGIIPILRRIVAVVDDRPVSVDAPVRYEGCFRFARERGGDRLFVNIWVSAFAPVGMTHAPPPAKDAPKEPLARIFAEHVITRPFATDANERRVTRLEAPGIPEVPEDEHGFLAMEGLIGEGAGVELSQEHEVVFGMTHTDANQHVNSLVYPTMFEEACVRHAAAGGGAAAGAAAGHLVRAVEIRWQKPFFAGQRATIRQRAEAAPAGWKALSRGGFFGAGRDGAAPRMHCAIAAWLR